jgi:hypothetical protein
LGIKKQEKMIKFSELKLMPLITILKKSGLYPRRNQP